MIIHCTKKLAARVPDVSKQLLTETSPLGSWHANLMYFDRRQCVLFCHDLTRAVLFAAGLRKPDFQLLGRELFPALLSIRGRIPFPKYCPALFPCGYFRNA